ncbi:MAG: hypothetical protein IAE92_09945 [Burkholderiaceae bacterium]|nr:hypothetical protein [Burkholderiaceae bacterium]
MNITNVEPFILHVPVTGSQIADSTRATPEQCIAAQVAAVCAAIGFVVGQG